MRSIFHAAAVVAAGGALLAPVAFGQGAKPAPGCAGVYADKKGDVEFANLDITGFWFNHAGGKTTANLRIANLDRSMPSDATGVNWYVLWSVDDVQHFVQAQIELGISDEPTFSYGTVEETPNGTLRSGAGDTPGQFIEGEEGVISMEIPADVGGSSGSQLKATLADTQYSIGIPGVVSSLQPVDEAAGKPYTVNACEAGGAGPAPTPVDPSPKPAPTGREVAAGQLDAAVSTKVPRAKKVKKSLTMRLTSKAGITDVDAALFKGAISKKQVVAKGKLASAKGAAKLKLKVSRKIKKGSYTLYLVGKNADGKVADKSFKLKFK